MRRGPSRAQDAPPSFTSLHSLSIASSMFSASFKIQSALPGATSNKVVMSDKNMGARPSIPEKCPSVSRYSRRRSTRSLVSGAVTSERARRPLSSSSGGRKQSLSMEKRPRLEACLDSAASGDGSFAGNRVHLLEIPGASDMRSGGRKKSRMPPLTAYSRGIRPTTSSRTSTIRANR